MTKKQFIDYFIAFARIYLALVLILSGLDKINSLDAFAVSIENYRILPIKTINIFAITLPWVEVVTGAFLLLGIYIKENAMIAGTLLLVFTIAVISAVIRGLDIECGCQGTFDGQKVGIFKIIENTFLILAALISFKFPNQVLTFFRQN